MSSARSHWERLSGTLRPGSEVAMMPKSLYQALSARKGRVMSGGPDKKAGLHIHLIVAAAIDHFRHAFPRSAPSGRRTQQITWAMSNEADCTFADSFDPAGTARRDANFRQLFAAHHAALLAESMNADLAALPDAMLRPVFNVLHADISRAPLRPYCFRIVFRGPANVDISDSVSVDGGAANRTAAATAVFRILKAGCKAIAIDADPVQAVDCVGARGCW
ncbi:hypothetical protein V8E36_003055 [Tilletia maclaganii]